MAKRRMIVQIIPSVIFKLPSTISAQNTNNFNSPLQQVVSFTFCTDGDEFNALAGDVVERLVHVGDLVEAHLAAVGLGQGFAGNHLQQQHQLQTIAEILLDVLDGGARLPQVAVTPCCECLKTNNKLLIAPNCYWINFDSCHLSDNVILSGS